jgi:Tfp pilus assembly protein FimV
MAGLHRPALAIPAAAVKVHGGYLYVARPGDTLWSIASKLEPGGDPRVLVAQLAQQLHGSELVAGDELKLP